MSTLAVGKPALTPKALLHKKYGWKACYRIEEVHEPVENSCPGLALPQHVRCRYRCYLELPELSIVSDAFTRKKDAEQAAAQMAIEKLGIQAKADNLTPEEAWDELVARVSYLFSEEVNNLCKLIEPKAELDPLSIVILILKAARQCGTVEAIHVPCSAENSVGTLSINIAPNKYYMDEIARSLGVCDSSLVLISRMLLHRLPDGCYKLSREAILAAELPIAFTTRSNWRGPCPKELLCMFCRQHRLSEPTFSVKSPLDIATYPDHKPRASKLCDKVKALKSIKVDEFGWDGVPDSVDEHSGESVAPMETLSSVGDVQGPDSGLSPSQGSLACISYAVALVMAEEGMNELIERKDEFEFEVGTGAVIPQLETCVMQLSINQEARFVVALPSRDLILAAAGEAAKYFAQLLNFGCGSGSLLESLLEHKTTLQKIVGVDLSKKSLSRAAKMVHSKLSMNSNHGIQTASVKSAELYYGSITDFDPRLCAFDIGTCLEVIEHMEEDQAHMFGDVALGYFCPHTLIVSTPNYEYNPILQKTSSPDKDDDMDEKSQTSQCRFRNHDHKFEWTREQFEHWASNLAARHNYGVEFGGVGGSEGVEPGFASQIAIFRRDASHQAKQCMMNWESKQVYEVVWEWTDRSRSAA
ncbi:Small RNA 2'-O-methyltransferase [Acorus calamus]|uniref:Small RNA 2'-O-methyltransferase n=1 Tax=Acorus calamus TaxID=4465 RepID=A0AAV9C1Y7_ACOCL|nr:Small RNA 2'-O-methyltransferase [Acorus calamus]